MRPLRLSQSQRLLFDDHKSDENDTNRLTGTSRDSSFQLLVRSKKW